MTETETNGISAEAREGVNRYAREYRRKRLADPERGEEFREMQRKYCRDYYVANREHLQEKARLYYQANRERLKEKARQKRAQMREMKKQSQAE